MDVIPLSEKLGAESAEATPDNCADYPSPRIAASMAAT